MLYTYFINAMDAKPIKYLHDKNVGKYKMKMGEKYI